MDWIVNIINVFIYIGAFSMLCLNLWIWRRCGILSYRHLVGAVAVITLGVAVFLIEFDQRAVAEFVIAAFIAIWVVGVGLFVFDRLHGRAVKRETESIDRYRTRLDKVSRWTIAIMSIVIVTNVIYDMLLHSTGTRIDLALTDTAGFVLALYWLEKARPQIRVAYNPSRPTAVWPFD